MTNNIGPNGRDGKILSPILGIAVVDSIIMREGNNFARGLHGDCSPNSLTLVSSQFAKSAEAQASRGQAGPLLSSPHYAL
jgi:hypothetical protein